MSDSAARRLWEACLGHLELQVSRPNFQTWLKDTVGLSYQDGSLHVGTPSDFGREWLNRKLKPLIERTVAGIVGQAVQVSFLVWPEEGAVPTCRDGGGGSAQGLNPRYRFERLIVGEGNRLAHAAAVAVAEEPGSLYNPLFIYGGVGLGKSHLLHAIGHRARQKGVAHVLCASAERFTNEFVTSIAHGQVEPFRQKYRSPDLLLIDDIQFLAGKERTQEAFFYTFNDLHAAGKQIVLAGDRSPKLLTLLQDRLQSRFEGGLIADIQPPDLETRVAILRSRAQEQGDELPEETILYIAQRARDNVRQLEGCLNRLLAYARLQGQALSQELAARALADILQTLASEKAPGPEAILQGVSSYFGLSKQALLGPGRDASVSYARQMAAYLLKEVAGVKAAEIGRLLGNRNHSTILRACSRMRLTLEKEPKARRQLAEIKALLGH